MTPEQQFYYLKFRLSELTNWLDALVFAKNYPNSPVAKMYIPQREHAPEEALDAISLMLKDVVNETICHKSCKTGMYWCTLPIGHDGDHSQQGMLSWEDHFCDEWKTNE